MEVNFGLVTAFLVGLLGGVHCIGMCGGIVGALTFGLSQKVKGSLAETLPFLLAYNGGRILSYSLAGAAIGGLGAVAAHLMVFNQAQLVLQVVAGLFMVALGLYLGDWWFGLVRLERLGGVVWRKLEPLGKRLMPVHTPRQAFALGLVWGWLPCGLVYSVLIWAISAGSALEGGLLLFSFGLGTLPNLLAMGAVAGKLAGFLRQTWVRSLAGGAVVLFGLFTVVRPFI
jgi:sulfite exporter TauE/SafE